MSDQQRRRRRRRRASRIPHVVAALAVASAAGLLLPGCAEKSKPTLKEMPAAEQQAGGAREAAISYNPEALDTLVESIDAKARALPASGGAEAQRDAMRAVFDDLAQVLPILEGPEPSGAFRQQLRTLETARDRLGRGGGGDAAGAEPAIDTGLRAANAALRRIAQDESLGGQTLNGMLEKLDAKVDELDNVRSIGRPYVAADATVLMSQVVRQMADRALGRATDTPMEPPAPTEAAAAEPAPTTEPAPDAPAPDAPAPDAAAAPTEPPPAEPPPAPAETAAEPPAEAPAEAPADAPAEKTEAPAPEPAPEPAPVEDANK